MSLLFGCASHLLIDLPLFGGPVAMVLGAVFVMARAERRRGSQPRAPKARAS